MPAELFARCSSRLGAIFNASGDNASSNLVLRPYDRGLGESDIPTYPEVTLSDEAQRARKLLNARAHAFTVERTVPRGLQALRQLRAAWRRTGSEPTVEERVCAALNHRPKTVQPSDASLRCWRYAPVPAPPISCGRW